MSDTPLDRLAHAADRPDTVAVVAALLRAEWDPAAEFTAPDGERDAESHAHAVLAMVAAGGGRAELVGYLRRAEEVALGAPRTQGGFRWSLVKRIVSAALGLPAPPPGKSDARAI